MRKMVWVRMLVPVANGEKKKIFQVYFPLVWYLVINTIQNQKWLQLYVSYNDLDIFFLINIEGETRRKVHQEIDNWKKWFI